MTLANALFARSTCLVTSQSRHLSSARILVASAYHPPPPNALVLLHGISRIGGSVVSVVDGTFEFERGCITPDRSVMGEHEQEHLRIVLHNDTESVARRRGSANLYPAFWPRKNIIGRNVKYNIVASHSFHYVERQRVIFAASPQGQTA